MNAFQKLSSIHRDESLAIKDMAHQNEFFKTCFSVFFFSNQYDPEKIQTELRSLYSDNVIALSTAGEISNGIYQDHSVSGFSVNTDKCEAYPFLIENVSNLDKAKLNQLSNLVATIKAKNERNAVTSKTVCLLFVDGISGSEEFLMEILSDIVRDFPVVGGSNGDGLDFKRTSLYFKGINHSDAAVLLFLTTDVPFEIIKTQHFEISDKKLVITGAFPEKRVVTEINGYAAANAYADLLGIDVRELNSSVFSEFPLALNIANNCYVRSIRNINPDGSLTFYCAIENGLVLSVAKKRDIVSTTKAHLDLISSKIGGSKICILFECILRRLEVLKLPEANKKQMYDVYSDVNAVGFHTYGEQVGSLHINQTLTGVMFGRTK